MKPQVTVASGPITRSTEVLSTQAISTIRVIQVARSQGVPIYVLSSGSSADRARLTGYEASTYTEIDQALAAGWKAVVPERPINYGRLQDSEGYILENPVDGSGVYRIGSLLNGGESDGGDAQTGPDDCPVCEDEGPVGSTVNFANGNWRESFTDLALPGVGLPVVWSCDYASRAQGLSEVGYGWQHGYGMRLRFELNGDITYVQDDWKERAVLKPLPVRPYQLAAWAKPKVAPDYHVAYDSHFYSVHFSLIGQQLDLRATENTVEIFREGKRLESYVRSYVKGGYTTRKEHMPKSHRDHAEWTPERILSWAKKAGPQTVALLEAIMASKTHPQQGFKRCLGILRLGKHYEPERLERACARALRFRTLTYQSVLTILQNKLDAEPLPGEELQGVLPLHENIRGSAYYLN